MKTKTLLRETPSRVNKARAQKTLYHLVLNKLYNKMTQSNKLNIIRSIIARILPSGRHHSPPPLALIRRLTTSMKLSYSERNCLKEIKQ